MPEAKREFAETTGCSTRNCAIPTKAPITSWLEERIIEALDPQPNEEIVVTFTKRKKQP